MSSKSKKFTLAEKISDLITSVPKPFESDDEAEETKAKVVDYDDEFDTLDDFKKEFNSSVRKNGFNLLEETDKRYKGKKVSRKKIFNYESSENNSDDDTDHSVKKDIQKSESDEEKSDFSYNDLEDKEDDTPENASDNKSSNEENQSYNEENESNKNSASLQASESDTSKDEEEESDFEYFSNDTHDDFDSLPKDKKSKSSIKTVSSTNICAEIEKGHCVSEQLKLWENFLEIRIKLQKCLMSSNKMPQYDVYKSFVSENEFVTKTTEIKSKLCELINNLLVLQSNLLNNFPETKNIQIQNKKRKIEPETNKKRKASNEEMNEEITESEDEINDTVDNNSDVQEDSDESDSKEIKESARKRIKLSNFESILAKNHEMYSEYRNSVIQKWNAKTRIALGITKKTANESTINQIDFTLLDKKKLIMKTQLKRSEYDIVGKIPKTLEETDGHRVVEHDPEIFDDDDFYHQLLRDLIKYKSTDITDPIQLSKQWIKLQNMRSKMKRKIDTRATKGRKLRYNVHPKLVNFMAPITTSDTWSDRAKDELCRSLFGKSQVKVSETEKNATSTST